MLSATVTTDSAALAASLADWWALSGVDAAVQELPRDWLAKTLRPSPPPARQPAAQSMEPPAVPATLAEPEVAPPPAPTPAMPETPEAFMAWLADVEVQPERAFAAAFVMPQYLASPELLIVTDMPATETQLLAPPEAALIAAMMRAVGQNMGDVALASLLLARPAGGIVEPQLARQAGARLDHFIGLMRPKALLLLGDATGRALEEPNHGVDGPGQRFVNHSGGTIPVMHLPTPSVLLKHPSRKAAAWIELRRLAAKR